jgi:hypothetical protein
VKWLESTPKQSFERLVSRYALYQLANIVVPNRIGLCPTLDSYPALDSHLYDALHPLPLLSTYWSSNPNSHSPLQSSSNTLKTSVLFLAISLPVPVFIMPSILYNFSS